MIWHLGTGKPKLGTEKKAEIPESLYISLFVNYKNVIFSIAPAVIIFSHLGKLTGIVSPQPTRHTYYLKHPSGWKTA